MAESGDVAASRCASLQFLALTDCYALAKSQSAFPSLLTRLALLWSSSHQDVHSCEHPMIHDGSRWAPLEEAACHTHTCWPPNQQDLTPALCEASQNAPRFRVESQHVV